MLLRPVLSSSPKRQRNIISYILYSGIASNSHVFSSRLHKECLYLRIHTTLIHFCDMPATMQITCASCIYKQLLRGQTSDERRAKGTFSNQTCSKPALAQSNPPKGVRRIIYSAVVQKRLLLFGNPLRSVSV